jgi:Cullin binding
MTGIDTAQAFWALLLPHGMKDGALAHKNPDDEEGAMEPQDGFKSEYVEWWFEFLNKKGGKGVSKDTWNMVGLPLSIFSIADIPHIVSRVRAHHQFGFYEL